MKHAIPLRNEREVGLNSKQVVVRNHFFSMTTTQPPKFILDSPEIPGEELKSKGYCLLTYFREDRFQFVWVDHPSEELLAYNYMIERIRAFYNHLETKVCTIQENYDSVVKELDSLKKLQNTMINNPATNLSNEQ